MTIYKFLFGLEGEGLRQVPRGHWMSENLLCDLLFTSLGGSLIPKSQRATRRCNMEKARERPSSMDGTIPSIGQSPLLDSAALSVTSDKFSKRGS